MKTKQLLLSICGPGTAGSNAGSGSGGSGNLDSAKFGERSAGGSITVIGTIANAGAPDFNISSWSINLSDPLLTFDDTAFLASPLVLGAGAGAWAYVILRCVC